MRILVTGASGFIGKHTCALLVRNSHVVIPVVRTKGHAREINPECLDVVVTDLKNSSALEAVKEFKPEIVVHLAAEMPPVFSGEHALLAAEANAIIDRNVFVFCEKNKIGMIYASGTSIYGSEKGRAKRETDEPCPMGPYVSQKVQSEEYGKRFLFDKGLQFTSLRISAPYGPGQKARTVLHIFMDRALQGLPLFFHGSGTRQQDFTYIEDVAMAIALAAEAGKSGIFNVATGEPVTMKQLAQMVIGVIPACSSQIKSSGKKDPQEGYTALFSIEKAREELGWIPRVSLQEGLSRTVRAKLGGNT